MSSAPVLFPAPAIADPGLARSVAAAITRYERLRLECYRARPGNPDRIELHRFGAAWAFRFPAVGYFNQVQGLGDEEALRLDELDALYADLPAGHRLQVAPDADRAEIFARLRERGFRVSQNTVRLAFPAPRPAQVPLPPGLTIEPLRPGETEEFFRLYLECFGAAPASHDAALANLRRLPGLPGLHCLLARVRGRAAGLGMLHVSEGVAYFCAGAVREAWRGLGLQAMLVNERLRLAAEADCELAVSWTEEGGASHRNLAAAGFAPAYRDPVWSSPRRE